LRERASGPIFFPASGTRSKCQKTGTWHFDIFFSCLVFFLSFAQSESWLRQNNNARTARSKFYPMWPRFRENCRNKPNCWVIINSKPQWWFIWTLICAL
jgi:hypothetical protein